MSKICYFVIKFYHKTSINGKTCITKSYAYSNRNGHSPKYTGWGKNEHANFIYQLKDNIEISTIMLRKRQKKKLILVWMLLSIIEVIEHGGTVYSQKHYGHFMV